MKTAAILRDELFEAKERFDVVVFDHGLTPEERLTRWQAFLMKIEPLAKQLAAAEKRETSGRMRLAQRAMAGTQAAL